MMNTFLRKAVVVLVGCTLAAGVLAQEGGRGGRGARGGGERQRFDPARMQEMMTRRLKESLDVSDEEWQVLEPLVQNVMSKRQEMMLGRMRRPGRDGETDNTAFPEAAALREILAKDGATPEEIQTRLTAFKAARERKEAELKQAQDALREVLTVKQEATLVLNGTLD